MRIDNGWRLIGSNRRSKARESEGMITGVSWPDGAPDQATLSVTFLSQDKEGDRVGLSVSMSESEALDLVQRLVSHLEAVTAAKEEKPRG